MSVDPNNLSGTAKLSFSDDFNGLSLWNGTSGTWSTTFWYQDPNGSGSTITTTNEQEWYINANYGATKGITPWTVGSGFLTLTAAPASAATQAALGNHYLYTSGELNTFHSFAQTYGYFEISAKMPAGQGFWPAFWLLPEDGSWPPELDVLETLSSNPTLLTTTSHSNATGTLAGNSTVANTTTGFHTYGMDWEPDFITWYFDGQKVFQIATPADMNKPMYMLVNLAVGGNFAGNANGVTTGQMQVDYIHAYSADVAGGTASTSFNAATNTVTTNANYTVAAGVQNVILTGGGQTVTANGLGDTITSDNNNNILIGGAGNDTLIAGRGHDQLTGGAGADTFVYGQYPWDTGLITDFTPGQDKVDLRAMLSNVGYTGSDPVGAGYLTLKTDGAGATEVWFDPDGSAGSQSAVWVFSLANVQASQVTVQNGFIVGAGTTTPTPTPTPVPTPSPTPAPTPTPTPTATSVSTAAAAFTAPAGVTTITLTGSNQTVTGNAAGDTFVSNNNHNTLIGGAGADTFNMGRGGDSAVSGGGTDTFKFAELPWSSGHISGFTGQDTLDVLPLFAKYGYTGSNPLADGHLKLVADGAGGTQVWGVMTGLTGVSGSWLLTTIDTMSPANLAWQNGKLIDPPATTTPTPTPTPAPTPTPTPTGGQTYTSDNNGDHWTGTSGNDTFNLGRDGDVVTGNGGNDTFKFAELPWAGGHITDFNAADVLDLTGMMGHYGYAVADTSHRITFTSDSHGGTDVWFNMAGLAGGTGNWLLTDLDNVATTSVHLANGQITTTATGSGGATTTATAPPGSIAINGQTFTSDNYGDHWTGTANNDLFIMGRGGDTVTGGAGSDVFQFNEAPWAGGHITDFTPGQDQIDLVPMFTRYGYTGTDPVADGHLKVMSDGAGSTQIWFDSDGLNNVSGTWLLTTLDHVAPTSVNVHGGWITG